MISRLPRLSPFLRAPLLSLLLLPPAALLAQLNEGFDGVTPPVLPSGWSATNAEPAWITTSSVSDSAPNSAFVDEPPYVTDKRLDTPAITIPVGGALMLFRHLYFTELSADGGVLEISIAGGGFQDILAAGGSFLTGAYSGTIDPASNNPLHGRAAWTGNSSGYVTTTVNLPPAAGGQAIQLRWRMGTNVLIIPLNRNKGANPTITAGFSGWSLDSVSIPTAGFGQNFDTVTPPALPPGWTAGNVGDWVTDPTGSDSPPNDAHADELPYPDDRSLISPPIAIPTTGTATLTFRNRYDMETDLTGVAVDFGTLEISIAGGPFQDILAAGGAFGSGGYDHNGNTVWGGLSNAYVTTVATLPPSANGQSVQLRWRFVTDATENGLPNDGWRIDAITLATCPPTAVASAGASVICANSSTTLNGSGGDSCFWSPATWLSDPLSCTPAVVPNGAAGTIVYTLTVTRANCPPGSNTDTATVAVTSETTPIAAASATRTSICPGSSTVLRGTGGNTCTWTPTSGLSNPNGCATTARPTSTTTYSLKVTDVCGTSTNTAQVKITVTARPAGPEVAAPASASAGQTGLVASIVNPNPGSSYAWSFSPSTAATITSLGPSSIVFTANSEGPLTLSVTENDGTCVSNPTQAAIPVGPACLDPQPPSNLLIQASGNPDGPVTGIDFLDLSWTAPATPPSFYVWGLNGNPEQTTTETSVLDQPPTGNNDPITLHVRSACSEIESEPAEITVSPSPPGASFELSGGLRIEVGTPVVFTDTSVPAATSWLWLFGDGSDPETTQSVTHSFAEGTYTVFLIASNGAGSSAASQVLEVPQTVAPSSVLALETRPFDASRKERQRLTGVPLAGGNPRWLHVRSQETSREAVAFLRFLDTSGALILERRLSVSPGQEAVFDLNAYGLRGTYDLELVSLKPVTASVVEARTRETREVRRPQR